MRLWMFTSLLVWLLPNAAFAQSPFGELPFKHKSYFYSRASAGHTWSVLNKSPKQIRKARIQSVNLSYSIQWEDITETFDQKGRIVKREVKAHHEGRPTTEQYEYDKRGQLKRVIIYYDDHYFEGGTVARAMQHIYTYNLFGKPVKISVKNDWNDSLPDNTYIKYNLWLQPRLFSSYVKYDTSEEQFREQTIYEYNIFGRLKSILSSNEEKKPVTRLLRDPHYYRTLLVKDYYGERWRMEEWQETFYDELYFDYAFEYKKGRLQKAYWFASKVVTDSLVYKNGRLEARYLKADLDWYKDENYRFEYDDSGALTRMICNNGDEIITFDKDGFPQTLTIMKDGVEVKSGEIVYTFYEGEK